MKYNLPNQGVIYNFGENQSIGDLSSQYNNFKTLKTKPKLAYSALPLNLHKWIVRPSEGNLVNCDLGISFVGVGIIQSSFSWAKRIE